LEITFKDGIYHLSGRLDENAIFDSLKATPSPLKLNVGKIMAINSVGIRKFLTFTMDFAPGAMEFFECTPDFIANINVIPQLLGSDEHNACVRSFYIPYVCENCKHIELDLVETELIKVSETGDVELATRNCENCKGMMDLDFEENEYFLFLHPKAE
jgi:hypothetical protein